MRSAASRSFLVMVVGAVLFAGCSGSDDSSSPAPASSVAPIDDTTTTTVDNRTPEEIAIDRLDVMMFDLGVTDLEGTSNCVVERLESEDLEVTGAGTSELIALFGCDDDAISQWLPPTNAAVSPEVWACTVESIADWISDLTIPETGAFFDADQPSTEFIELTATRCDVSPEDLAAAF